MPTTVESAQVHCPYCWKLTEIKFAHARTQSEPKNFKDNIFDCDHCQKTFQADVAYRLEINTAKFE